MLTTEFLTGSPNWVDLGVTDVTPARAFYGSVFGWDYLSAGPESGGYGFFTVGGKTVAGVGPLMEPGSSPSWQVYFHTADVDTLAKTVAQAGGAVRFPPMDVMTAGRMGGFADPAGAKFNVWQPRDTPGLAAVNEANTLCWTELATTDQVGAKTFYDAVFGWTTEDMPFGGGGVYTIVKPSGGDENSGQGGIMTISPEMAGGGLAPRWQPYFEVVDCDAAASAISGGGGTVLMGPTTMEGVGRMAAFLDPFGAAFSVITSVAM